MIVRAIGEIDTSSPNVGPYVRCLGCGGMVQQPCLLCQRRHAANTKLQLARATRHRTERHDLAAYLRRERHRLYGNDSVPPRLRSA